ncbi:MAG: hypothetical protein KDI33_20545 [Halioglobus sp.]|nr:hypothetical protein [Halioglobus sp.]
MLILQIAAGIVLAVVILAFWREIFSYGLIAAAACILVGLFGFGVYVIFEYSEELFEHAFFILGVIVAALVVFGLYRLATHNMDNAKQKLYKSKGIMMEDVTDLAFGIFAIAIAGSGVFLAVLSPDEVVKGVAIAIGGLFIGLSAGVPSYRNIRRSLEQRRQHDNSC